MMERRRPGRNLVERGMHWLYYWLDLYGDDGHPSYHKVLGAWGFALALIAEVWWGFWLANKEGQGVTWPYVWLVLGTLAVPMGRGVFARVFGSGPPVANPIREDLP